jgi:hypothetical protein
MFYTSLQLQQMRVLSARRYTVKEYEKEVNIQKFLANSGVDKASADLPGRGVPLGQRGHVYTEF